MNVNTIVLQGTVKTDGTLELAEKIPLPAGQVQVTLQQLPSLPEGDPFFDLLRSIWKERAEAGLQPRSIQEVEAERRRLRDESEQEIAEAMRLQEEARLPQKLADIAERETE